ncbi:MAG: hypothetical protein M5U01_38900 [Ardenticatenaceae bacterium]|nr:hypothetical protein [Ardenticatenaceae bacterium]
MTHDTIKSIDPGTTILLGGLGSAGVPGMDDANFLAQILADPDHPAARNFDIANFHHYGSDEEARRQMASVQKALAGAGAADRPTSEVWWGSCWPKARSDDRDRGGDRLCTRLRKSALPPPAG